MITAWSIFIGTLPILISVLAIDGLLIWSGVELRRARREFRKP